MGMNGIYEWEVKQRIKFYVNCEPKEILWFSDTDEEYNIVTLRVFTDEN